MAKKTLKEGDILMNTRSLLVQYLGPVSWDDTIGSIQFIDGDEPFNWSHARIATMENLGQSPEMVATFVAARGIHLRLNRMSKV